VCNPRLIFIPHFQVGYTTPAFIGVFHRVVGLSAFERSIDRTALIVWK
jgi:hypothetical protein